MRLLWDLWVGALSLIGSTILIFAGIALCAYATANQLNERHDTQLDSILFAIGVILFASSAVRRLIWMFLGVALVWAPLGGGVIYLTLEDVHHFEPNLMVLSFALAPPFLVTLLLLVMGGGNPVATKRDPDTSLSDTPEAGED
jgi:hypothetical protein